MRARILGTGKALPARVLTNADLAQFVDTTDEWIVERSGIRERRVLEEGRTASDLAVEASRLALEAAGCPPDELDLIVCATVTPDEPMPSCAVVVQHKLGARCAAFDVAAACAGFVYGLAVAEAFVRAGTHRRVLLVGVDVLSRFLDWNDRTTCVLFGDGAGAVLLGPAGPADLTDDGEERGVLSTHLYADGAHASLLHIPGGGASLPPTAETVAAGEHSLRMAGRPVFAHAVRDISRAALAALSHNGKTAAEVDRVIAHQANLRILEAVAEKTGIPIERFQLNIDRYGNTSSASIPIALDEALREGTVRAGDLVLFGALGAGFAWGSALVRL